MPIKMHLPGSKRPRVLLLLTFALVLAPLAARAAGAAAKGDAPEDPLKAAYREASAEYALGNFRAALAKFELAFRIKQVPGLLFNIAQCHRQLKNFEQAQATYRSFIRLDPNSSQIGLAKELLKQVDEVLRTQTTAQNAPPLDANGNDVVGGKPDLIAPSGAAPKPLIVANTKPSDSIAPAAKPSSTTPSSAAASTSSTNSSAAPASGALVATASAPRSSTAAPEVATVSATPAPPKHSNHIIAWTAGGAGVLALGGGALFALQAKSAQNDLAAGNTTRSTADGQISSLSRDASIGNALFIGGAVLLAGAVTCWFLGAP